MKPDRTPKRLSLGLHTLYMSFLFPSFLLITILVGMNNFVDMYTIIENNFGEKLEAISLVTGAFLDGEPVLDEPPIRYSINAMATTSDGMVLGYDPQQQVVLSIHPQHGGADEVRSAAGYNWGDLTYDSQRDLLVGIQDDGTLNHIPLDSANPITSPGTAGVPSTALAYHPGSDRYLLWSDGLLALDPESMEIQRLSSDETYQLNTMMYDNATSSLIALQDNSLTTLRIDPESGIVVDTRNLQMIPPTFGELAFPDDSELWKALQVDRIEELDDPIAEETARQFAFEIAKSLAFDLAESDTEAFLQTSRLAGITSHPSAPVWLSSSPAFTTIDPESGSVWHHGFFPEYINELSAVKLELLSPMRRVAHKLNLTYLYTFYRADDFGILDIVYSLDANIDTDHSFAGATDVLPEDSVFDMYGRILLDEMYLSDIVEWDEWGLIKTGYAPIEGRNLGIQQVVGADINVSIIESRTRIFLLQTIGIGTLLFFVTAIISFSVASALIRPIQKLNDTALVVAAGAYGEQTPVSGPSEFRDLCEAFNALSVTMKDAEDKRNFDNQVLQFQTARAELLRNLTRTRDIEFEPLQNVWSAIHFHQDYDHTPITLATQCESGVFGWMGYDESSIQEALSMQLSISWVARKLLASSPKPWNELLPILQHWYPGHVDTFFFVDKTNVRVYWYSRSEIALVRIRGEEVVQQSASTGDLDLASDDVLLMGAPPLVTEFLTRAKEKKTGLAKSATLSAIAPEITQAIGAETLGTMKANYIVRFHWEAS